MDLSAEFASTFWFEDGLAGVIRSTEGLHKNARKVKREVADVDIAVSVKLSACQVEPVFGKSMRKPWKSVISTVHDVEEMAPT